MESPRNYKRDIKLYEPEINRQKVRFVVEKRRDKIWRITVISGDDMTELRLNEFNSKTQELGARIAR